MYTPVNVPDLMVSKLSFIIIIIIIICKYVQIKRNTAYINTSLKYPGDDGVGGWEICDDIVLNNRMINVAINGTS